MQKYQILGKKGEGTFSEVLKAQDMETHQLVAIKCMKKPFKNKEQVNRLREIQAVRRLQPHPNIVPLLEVLFDRSTGRLALVMELLEMNLYELIKSRRQYLGEDRVMSYMYQLLKGLNHAHRIGLFHRDIKPENLLISADGVLKIADFGSCKGVYSKQPLTEYISTRWYRAPECLLTNGYYGYKMDLWSAGCVFFEMCALFPLFPGNNELDQVHKIHNVLGSPPPEVLEQLRAKGAHFDVNFPTKQGIGLEKLLPSVSRDALDLMSRLLSYSEEKRCTAKEALRHPYFKRLRDAERKQRVPGSGNNNNNNSATATAAAAEHATSSAPLPGGVARGGDGGGEEVCSASDVKLVTLTSTATTMVVTELHSNGSSTALPCGISSVTPDCNSNNNNNNNNSGATTTTNNNNNNGSSSSNANHCSEASRYANDKLPLIDLPSPTKSSFTVTHMSTLAGSGDMCGNGSGMMNAGGSSSSSMPMATTALGKTGGGGNSTGNNAGGGGGGGAGVMVRDAVVHDGKTSLPRLS